MVIRILGPLEVSENGCLVQLGGGKQRTLLVDLVLHRGEPLSVDRLIDDLWAEQPPPTAAKTLQGLVSRLRRTLGHELIVTRTSGYILSAELLEVDADVFSRLVGTGRAKASSGDAAAAAAAFREALALWRGPPLADFAYDSFAQRDIARLEEERLSALEDRIDADLALCRHVDVTGELDALVTDHPLRERLRGQLMLALYRSGRSAEALEHYQQARRELLEELGIEPGKSLRRLEQAILAQDPTLDDGVRATQGPIAARPATAVSPEPELARDVRKTVTVVFASLTSSSDRGEGLDPEALRGLTRSAFAEIRAAVEHHEGVVGTVAGETVTAIFGLPAVHEDDAMRAGRAAVEMCERLEGLAREFERRWGATLALTIGISTGQVVAGSAAPADATGAPVAVAARLARDAAPGVILADEATRRLLRHATLEPDRGTFRLVDIADAVPAHTGRFEAPMVGRAREQRRIQDAFAQAVGDRSSQLFTVLGAAGVGKSRLVHEFLAGIEDEATVIRGRCLPYGEGITYWPVMEAVKEAAQIDDAESLERGREKLGALLEGEDDADAIARGAAELTGLADAVGGAEDAFSALRGLFEALARRGPLVVVFDDIHWGEATFLDLVEYLADWTRGSPILFVCLARPELLDLRPSWGGGKVNATSVLLEPLSDAESARLLANLVGPTELADEVANRVAEAAEGNPLFVEELFSMLIDDGLLVRRDHRWEVTGDLTTISMPPTIQALLAARLDLLGTDERAAIERASVEGKLFHQDWVAALAPEATHTTIGASLASLVRKELIRPDQAQFSDDRAFGFRHLLIRDAAYESIPKETRAHLHERCATWLEQKAGERIVEYEEIVGYHLEQAFRYRTELSPVDEAARNVARRAAERLGAAGRRAFSRRDAPAALNLISRAAALLPADDPARVDLVPNVRVVQGMSGDLSWADTILSEAAATGDERVRTHALVQRGLLRLFTQPDVTPDELIETAEEAKLVFERLGDELGLARAWRLVAQAQYLARCAGACSQTSEQALRHARRAGDPLEVREIVEWLAVALALGPAPAPAALRRCEELSLSEATHDPALEETLLSVRAHLQGTLGQVTESEQLFARARQAVEGHGHLERVPYFTVYAGLAGLLTGDASTAERDLRASCQALADVGEKTNYSSVAALLAQVLCTLGRYAEADEFTRASEAAARANDVLAHILWRAARAKALAHQGELEAALALAREAVGFAEESDFLNAHGDALMSLAEVLALSRRASEAEEALSAALERYERKGNVVAAAKARALLEAADQARRAGTERSPDDQT